MKKKRRTFFERLTGAVNMEEFNEDDLEEDEEIYSSVTDIESPENEKPRADIGQLSVDVINSPEEIIIRAIVAGVKPHELDIQISRDMVTINGQREEETEIEEQDYYHRELIWGSFSRNILLPEEIDVELSNAEEKHGILEIHLPKIDKDRKTKLQVKSH